MWGGALAPSATLRQLQLGAHFLRALERVAEAVEDLDRTRHKVGVARRPTATDVQVVFQADPDVAAGDGGQRYVLHLAPAERERAPRPRFGHVVDHRHE